VSAWRPRRRRLKVLEWIPVPDTSLLLDGFPCPYCGERTAPDAEGIWKCLCGWSGALFASPHPLTPDSAA
jgi:hypothetical protein